MDASPSLHLQALAFIYDNKDLLPTWMRRLTPGQISEFASVIARWEISNMPRYEVLPLETLERREVARAMAKFGGDVCAAAKALGIGKTTLYRKLKAWGFSSDTWQRISQAAVLAQKPTTAKVVPPELCQRIEAVPTLAKVKPASDRGQLPREG